MRWGIAAAMTAFLLATTANAAAPPPDVGTVRLDDGSRYDGEIVRGLPNGSGTLINRDGDRFTGTWTDGELNGRGSVVWANGDRYDGEFVDGKAEGHGVQIWANGQRYDGAWHNDKPHGTGTVTRKDGTTFTANFVDGKRQPSTVAAATPAAPMPATIVAPAVTTPVKPEIAAVARLAGRQLRAIDGSLIAITPRGDNSFERAITAGDGTVQRARFTLLGNGMGSIAGEDGAVIGFFKVSASGVEATFADGHSETATLNSEGGLSLLARAQSGETSCTAWFPEGHVFSAEERKLAVAAYARRLGVAPTSAPSPLAACNVTAKPVPATMRAPAATTPVPRGKPTKPTAALPVPPELQAAASGSNAGALLNVPVRDSTVHPVDAGVSDSGVVPTPEDAIPRDERIASNCLKVDSDGQYWGFRNHCGYSVQFAYCLLRGPNPLTACATDGRGVVGSVSANGFGALFADDSLSPRGAEHAFRWVGCRGGAGEVAVHLDQFEPAIGRCVRAPASLARAQ